MSSDHSLIGVRTYLHVGFGNESERDLEIYYRDVVYSLYSCTKIMLAITQTERKSLCLALTLSTTVGYVFLLH